MRGFPPCTILRRALMHFLKLCILYQSLVLSNVALNLALNSMSWRISNKGYTLCVMGKFLFEYFPILWKGSSKKTKCTNALALYNCDKVGLIGEIWLQMSHLTAHAEPTGRDYLVSDCNMLKVNSLAPKFYVLCLHSKPPLYKSLGYFVGLSNIRSG